MDELINSGKQSFYEIKDNARLCYDIDTKDYKIIEGQRHLVMLEKEDLLPSGKTQGVIYWIWVMVFFAWNFTPR